MKPGETIVHQNDDKIPYIAVSEEKIAEDAPLAIAFLQKREALDLAEALGLRNYTELRA